MAKKKNTYRPVPFLHEMRSGELNTVVCLRKDGKEPMRGEYRRKA